MKLVIGGAFQGKLKYAFELRNEITVPREEYARGDQDEYETAFQRPVVHGFHCYIRRLLREEQDAVLFAKTVVEQNPHCMIVMDEIGCGIVPIEKSEREYRETVGRIGQYLASEADAVYRVICGIGSRIK